MPTHDTYLAAIPPDHREALQRLRDFIHQLVPDATECVSYGLPAFRLGKKHLVAYGNAKKHCAFYPMSGSIVTRFADRLEGYSLSKGTIRFSPERPIPDDVVRDIVLARIEEDAGP
jgi:uncharacterized protein YdhG (YjbR/CyaY superfamily)